MTDIIKCIIWTMTVILILTTGISAVEIPILVYHDFSDTYTGSFVISGKTFAAQLSMLRDEGYETVSFREIINYVYCGGELPDKPIIITSDDGYRGVIDIAAPCAGRYGMKLTCAVIGEMAESGGHFSLDGDIPDNVEIVSHTYSLHECTKWLGHSSCDMLEEDCEKFGQYVEMYPLLESVMIYPHGEYTESSETCLRELGFVATVTCDRGISDIESGKPETLFALRRIPVWENTTPNYLLKTIKRYSQQQ